MSRIGTLAWTRRTQGHLSPRDRLDLAARGVAAQLSALSDQAAARLGLRRDKLARVDLAAVKLPQSAAAKEAEQVADEFPPFLWHHSHRAYLWATALGEHDGLTWDPELLYCACLLHDAGLPKAVERGDARCFTLASAELADGCSARAGWPDDRRDRLAEAITLHINGFVSADHGIEAHLLTTGTTLDGIGARLWNLHPEYVDEVMRRHPRHRFGHECHALFDRHRRQAPRARVAFFYRYGGLGRTLRRSPLEKRP